MARDDPSAFISYCFTDPLGHPIRQAPVHDELQAFLSQHPKALIELPRDHGKSFQVCCRVVWELGRNPALRVKIVCATGGIAAERARFLREAIENNHRVRLVFPELQPDSPWAASSFAVARPAHVIGPSVAAYGVGAGSTGTRADLLICDDVVDVRSLHNRAERDRVSSHFHDNLMNLLEPEGRFWGLFTPWHENDLNARLKKNHIYALFKKAIGPDFEPVWPEKWSPEKLRARKAEIGSASFARGYRLVPVMDEDTAIRAAWVRFWTEPTECDMVILSVDPAVSLAARADRSALVVLGRTASRKFEARNPKSEMKTDANSEPVSNFAFRASNLSAVEIRVLLHRSACLGAGSRQPHRNARQAVEPGGDPVRVERGIPRHQGFARAAYGVRPAGEGRVAIG